MSAPVLLGEHKWVGSATILLSEKEARSADHRGSYRIETKQRVDVLEIYCRQCRRRYEDAKDDECVLGQWHRGGPIDTRKRVEAEEYPDALMTQPQTLRASGG